MLALRQPELLSGLRVPLSERMKAKLSKRPPDIRVNLCDAFFVGQGLFSVLLLRQLWRYTSLDDRSHVFGPIEVTRFISLGRE